MAQQVIAPIIPNIGMQESAIAGSSAVIFTSTDRKIIKERTGEVDQARSFKELFSEKSLAPKVENEESTIKPEIDVAELEYRQREHRKMLKNSPLAAPRDKTELTEEKSAAPEIVPPNMVSRIIPPLKESVEKSDIKKQTKEIAKDINLNADDIIEKFVLDEEDLHQLVFKIKELHLARLLTNSRKEFEKLSKIIKDETLGAARPEARDWINSRLDNLRLESAGYKLKLLNSLKSMRLNSEQEKNISWLKKIANKK